MGYMIDGTHAEYVRTPFADTSLYLLPEGLNEEVAVFLSDVLPTSHEIGVQYGNVKPGDTIAIVRPEGRAGQVRSARRTAQHP